MEENQFIEVMRKHSDEKLLEILNVKRKDYVADAITAAEEVLIERGVSFTKIQNEKFEEKDNRPFIEKIRASSEKIMFGHIIDIAFITILTFLVKIIAMLIESTSMSELEIRLSYSAFYFLYFFGLETTNGGKTIGKRLLKMSVINNKGESLSITQIFIRCLCRFIPFDAISFLCGWNWHDFLSTTYVVDDKKMKKQ